MATTPQRIQLRRDTAAEWQRVNPILSSGEPGVETDTGKWKIGDGKSAWKVLPYKAEAGPAGPVGGVGPAGTSGPVGPAGPKGDAGPAGAAGPVNVLSIGSVSGGPTAFVSLSGAAPNQVLNLTLPKGDKGEVSSLSIGTVQAGASPAATITGNAPNQVLNLSLPKGDKGDAGPQGTAGAKGDAGAAGPTGPKGEAGATGPQGAQGLKGDTGAAGTQGSQGAVGPVGPAGSQGPQGIKGDTGATGPQGPKGDTGAAARIMGEATRWPPSASPAVGDLWIADDPLPPGFPARAVAGDGFVWTGTQWINAGPIRGPKGDPGPKGDTGPTGPTGQAGAAGVTGATGPVGPKGDPGATGPQGNQGLKGDAGSAGVAGPKGDTGAAGPAGAAASISVGTVTSGDIPSVSIRGTAPNQIMDFTLSKGAKGDTGLTGPMGPQGTAGPANILRIGLVTTGKTANAIISGTAPSQTLSFILPEAVTTSLSIGTVNMGDAPAATITGSPPNQVLNLTFPKYRPEPALSFSSDGPLPVTAAVGTAWEMFSSATSTEFPIVYQWQYTDTPEVEESWKDIAGQGSESLRRIASVDNGGRWYRNTATTASNKTTSRMAQLTVFSDPSNPDGNRQEWFNQPVPSQGYPLFGRVRPFTTTADGVYLQLNDGVLIRDDRVRQLDALPIKQANNRLFMSSCYSDDGTTWVPFIKGPMDFLEGGSGPAAVVSDVAYANGVYHMWLTNRRNGTGEDAFWLYQQRFVSSDCKVWSIIPNDRWPSTGTWRQLANGQIEFGGDVSQGLWPQWQKSSLDWKTRSATPLPFPPQTICEVLLWEKVNNVEAICYAYIANKTKTRIGLCQLPDDIVLCGLSYGYVPAYDKYCYVGLASNNKIYVCPDPATSTTYDAYDIPPGPFFTQPAYAKKCWLATAVSPSSIYFTSEDLKTWTAHQQPFAFPDDYCGRVISFKDRFIYLSVYTSSISPGLVEGMQSSITIFHSL